MFSPNEVKNYQQITASDSLKEKIMDNINTTQRKIKRIRTTAIRFAAATACMALVVFGLNMYLLKNHVLSIQNVPVLYNSRTIDDFTSPSVANFQQERLQICIPLEVRVYQDTEITVSDGIVTTNEQSNVDPENQMSTIRIKKPEDILWLISKTDAQNARCNILTDDREYVYELFYNKKTQNYNIRQLKNKKQ